MPIDARNEVNHSVNDLRNNRKDAAIAMRIIISFCATDGA
jgi:hypothetical protein